METDHLEDLGVDGNLILTRIFKKCGGHGMDCSDSRQGQVPGACECGNEPSGYVKCGEFLDWLTTRQLRRKDNALRR